MNNMTNDIKKTLEVVPKDFLDSSMKFWEKKRNNTLYWIVILILCFYFINSGLFHDNNIFNIVLTSIGNFFCCYFLAWKLKKLYFYDLWAKLCLNEYWRRNNV